MSNRIRLTDIEVAGSTASIALAAEIANIVIVTLADEFPAGTCSLVDVAKYLQPLGVDRVKWCDGLQYVLRRAQDPRLIVVSPHGRHNPLQAVNLKIRDHKA